MDYTTVPTNHDLRLAARKQLKGVWWEMARAVFVFCLLYITPFLIILLVGTGVLFLDLVLALILCLIAKLFASGFAGFYIKRVRGGQIAMGDIFDSFKQRFWDNFLLALFGFVFVFLWSLLLVVPGIIKALAYSMSFYIMRDNPGIRPLQAITKSRRMMDGSKGRLFMLCLSFIGWYLLCLVPAIIGILFLFIMMAGVAFGADIGYLVIAVVLVICVLLCVSTLISLFYLVPYMSLTVANFYEDLKTGSEKYSGSRDSDRSKNPENSGGGNWRKSGLDSKI